MRSVAGGAVLALALAACDRHAPNPITTAPTPTAPTTGTPAGPTSIVAQPEPAPSLPEQLERYKRDAASRIESANPAWTTDAAPEPLLRAVIVVRVRVDAQRMPHPELMRSPNAALGSRTLRSIQAAAPFPEVPSDLRDALSKTGYIETWLYNRDGRFQIRTIAKPQRTE